MLGMVRAGDRVDLLVLPSAGRPSSGQSLMTYRHLLVLDVAGNKANSTRPVQTDRPSRVVVAFLVAKLGDFVRKSRGATVLITGLP